LTYHPISKINYNTYCILVYCVSNRFIIDTYIASYSKKNDNITATLHISQIIGGGDTVLYFSPKNGKRIEIYSKLENDGTVKTYREVYKLDNTFSPIEVRKRQKFPSEPIIVEPTPVLIK
jgi:hypothetical protein